MRGQRIGGQQPPCITNVRSCLIRTILTASHSLGEVLGLGKLAAKEVYAALDWLGREQPFIEAQLARRHLQEGALLLYDVTSTYLEGRCCELAQHGYSRDHRGDRPQIAR